MMAELCREFKIEHHNSSPYRPKMNGAVEAANKNIKKIVQKMVVTYKDWHEMLPFALHGYQTSVRTSTGVTPFSLVYGMEAVLPVEVQIPSLRVLMDVKLQEAEWVRTRYEELSLIEEKRLAAICHGQLYQQRMKRAFDRKVRPRVYHVGDLVLKRILPPQNDRRGKWTPNYEGAGDLKVCMNPMSSISVEYGEVENTRVRRVDGCSVPGFPGFPKQSWDCYLPSRFENALVVSSPVKSPSGSGSVEVIPGEGGPFPAAVLFPSRMEIGVLSSSSAEFLELLRRVP
ncbi:hypothetical protein KIW84_073006 [Lathyrus oleraceus]|uniref:Integrase catalytic domain-containing protein n=1 Tax=Pisum sativum TaxID=3888 RepID=A0A9D4ZVY9_PEA|nr:hypothetical protein KIW84_073006 [Pisum sativum]